MNRTSRGRVQIGVLSVVTLVRNRNRMLDSLCASLAAQTSDAFELTVVRAGGVEDPLEVTTRWAPDIRVAVHDPSGSETDSDVIDYSRARNAGAVRSSGDGLMFVDADTMLGPRSIEAMSEALAEVDALCTGRLRYLPPGHGDLANSSFSELAATARPHPARPSSPPTGVRLGSEHDMVWGLNMGLRATTFHRVGGFDRTYRGYAGEDTDLARSVRQLGVPTAFVAGVEILHQHHETFEPPLQQFDATLANARRFHEKWGDWPMGGWLDGFERLGLIERHAGHLDVLRQPTPPEVDAARCSSATPFRSERSARP